MKLSCHSGFSLVEMLVSSVVMLIVFAMVISAFVQSRKISRRNEMDVELLQSARIALDEMARTIRMAGYRRDKLHGQVALIEAAPFQIIFNGNLDQAGDFSRCKGALGQKVQINLYDATQYFTPAANYTTEAETIHFTLDTRGGDNSDGVVDENDINDNVDEEITRFNPDDMILVRKSNLEEIQRTASGILGPFDHEGNRTNIVPMFQYWLLQPDNSFTLMGDKDGNRVLEGDERYFRSITSQQILTKVRRIRITVTTESDHKDPFVPKDHRRITVDSEVNLRNIE